MVPKNFQGCFLPINCWKTGLSLHENFKAYYGSVVLSCVEIGELPVAWNSECTVPENNSNETWFVNRYNNTNIWNPELLSRGKKRAQRNEYIWNLMKI